MATVRLRPTGQPLGCVRRAGVLTTTGTHVQSRPCAWAMLFLLFPLATFSLSLSWQLFAAHAKEHLSRTSLFLGCAFPPAGGRAVIGVRPVNGVGEIVIAK